MSEKTYQSQISEPKLQAYWQEQQIYAPDQHPGPRFTIDTPPPTVSGALHIGHVFSYTQADIIARYQRFSGYSVFYPMGFDDNGLATERFVEQKLGIRAAELSRAAFTELCLRETQLAITQFKTLWEQLGLSVNWQATYSTIAPNTRRIAQESFIRLLQAGHVYRKQEPALYCTTCQTTVAQAELESVEIATVFSELKFQLLTPTTLADNDLTSAPHQNQPALVIATTRPELLASCVALFYHPDDQRYQHLQGQQALVPVFNYSVPILADSLVDPQKGTGLVMCCTFGDKNDIEWYKRHQLPYRPSLGLNGRWLAATGPLAGLKVNEARTKILELLQDQGAVLKQTPLTHQVQTHERCKKAIEYQILTQWFINVLAHKATFLALGEQINWYPQFMHARYRDWVENLSWDWCISRQRFYGVPFPVWHCQNCQAVLLPPLSALPVDPQATDSYQITTCTQCHSTQIQPDMDVMDTWNTSSLTPQICYSLWANDPAAAFTPVAEPAWLPMSLRPQAHDIIRTWAFEPIVKAYFHFNQIPWRDIMISGHVLSSDKAKLSKSQANSKITPTALLAQYSADAVRYWTATGHLGADMAFAENQLRIGHRLVTKLWNAFRFIGEQLTPQFVPATELQQLELDLVNQWLLHRVSATFTLYEQHLAQYEFGLALQTLEQFFWHDFCDNYLELIKHQLFNPTAYTAVTLIATKNTLYHVGLRLLQLYAPYLPYITDELFLTLYAPQLGLKSVHLTKFAALQTSFNFPAAATLMTQINQLVAQVRKLKSLQQLSLKTPLSELQISCDQPELQAQLALHEQLLRGITQAEKITYTTTKLNAPTLTTDPEQRWSAQVLVNESVMAP